MGAVIAVSTTPGATGFTRMPRLAHATARDLVGALDDSRAGRRRLSQELHRAAVVAEELPPEVIEVRLGLEARALVRLRDVHVADHEAIVGRRGPAVRGGARAELVEHGLR